MKMDHWVLRQIRAMVLTDLKAFIPEGHFEKRIERIWLTNVKNADYHNENFQWGYKAFDLRKLVLFPPNGMTSRQVSAADVLMNMGLFSLTETAKRVTEDLSAQYKAKGLPDCAAKGVHERNQANLDSAERDLTAALKGYRLHLNDKDGNKEGMVLDSLWIADPSTAPTSSSQEKHIPKTAQQEQAIIETLKEKGYTPTKLPKRTPGKSWVKSEVKTILLTGRLDLFTANSFGKAWGRLSANGDIAEAP